MSLDQINEELAKPRGGKWAKLLNPGDRVVGILIDGEKVNRTDPEGNVVVGKKSGEPRKVFRLWLQTDERADGDDDGVRIFDANESAQRALAEIQPLQPGWQLALAVTAAAPSKFEQCTYKAQQKKVVEVAAAPTASAEDIFGDL